MSFSGQVALVTGASRGIGLCVGQTLASYGATVMLTARTSESVSRHAEMITSSGGTAAAMTCDVTCFNDVQRSVVACIDTFGRLDILINNAGTIDPISRLETSDVELWARAIDTNVKGVYHGMRAALPTMLAAGSGTIVNMSSGAANSALEGWSHYCCSKAAVKKLTECAHAEVGARGVRVVGLSPGTVATGMMAQIRASGVNPVSQLDWSSHIPPEWAAKAVAFLCGPGGAEFAGTDFSIKTTEGRRLVGLAVPNES